LPSKLRARLTYANVMATIAVFVALGGSSYAAIKVTGKNVTDSSLTGKDIKNNSVTDKDVKGIKTGDVTDRSLLAKDFKPGQLPAGAPGEKGEAGTSVFASSVPSGTTVRGSWGAAGDVETGGFFEVGVSLPVPAPVPMEDVKMGAAQPNANNTDPACAGSVNEPSAPPGKVCVYVLPFTDNVSTTGITATPMGGSGAPLSDRFGFLIGINPAAPGNVEAYGTWAYTAP
jgi:hypothetical protein